MAEVSLAIYKTPSQAEDIGTHLKDTRTITRQEAIELRDFCAEVEAGRKTTLALINLASRILGPKLNTSVTRLISAITGGARIIGSYYQQLEDQTSQLVDTMGANQQVTFTYKYRRKGSNDGAYWLIDIS